MPHRREEAENGNKTAATFSCKFSVRSTSASWQRISEPCEDALRSPGKSTFIYRHAFRLDRWNCVDHGDIPLNYIRPTAVASLDWTTVQLSIGFVSKKHRTHDGASCVAEPYMSTSYDNAPSSPQNLCSSTLQFSKYIRSDSSAFSSILLSSLPLKGRLKTWSEKFLSIELESPAILPSWPPRGDFQPISHACVMVNYRNHVWHCENWTT